MVLYLHFPAKNKVKAAVLKKAVQTIYGSNNINKYTNVQGNEKNMPTTDP